MRFCPVSVFFPLVATLFLSSAYAQEDEESTLTQIQEESPDIKDLFQAQKWSELDSAMKDMKSASIQEWLMGAKAALEVGNLQHAHQRYKKSSILDPKIGCPVECRILREETANVKLNGEGALLFDEQAPYYLLRGIDKANESLSKEQFFSGR